MEWIASGAHRLRLLEDSATFLLLVSCTPRGYWTGIHSNLFVTLPAVYPPLRHTLHRQACRTRQPGVPASLCPAASAPSARGARLRTCPPLAAAPEPRHTQRPARHSADALPRADPSRPVHTRTLHPLHPLSE